MTITKFGHSCVLIDDHHTRIMIDPGVYSELPETSPDLHAVLITHKHEDHLSKENLSLLAQANPDMTVICNQEVANEIRQLNFNINVLAEPQSAEVGHLEITAHGRDHATIHESFPKIANTGYLINQIVFHPGDSLQTPPVSVEILLLPIVAPWSKISETMDFVLSVKPKVVIPIHDGFLKFGGPFYAMLKQLCQEKNIKFIEQINYQPYEN